MAKHLTREEMKMTTEAKATEDRVFESMMDDLQAIEDVCGEPEEQTLDIDALVLSLDD